MMEIAYWLLIVFLLTYEPIYGYFDYQRFKAKVRVNPDERVRYYKKIMIGLWIPVFVIICFVFWGPLTLTDIGLNGITLNTERLGKWLTYVVTGSAIGIVLIIIYQWIGTKVSKKMRIEIMKAKEKQLETSKFSDILPVSKKDKVLWTYVSWTAGITEEIIYRGFLLFALSTLFPSLSIWVILIASSFLFGLAHSYQGLGNVIRTTIIGLYFAVLYVVLGSIIPLILIHFLLDYAAKLGDSDSDN